MHVSPPSREHTPQRTIDLGDLSVPVPEPGPPQVSRETRRGLLIAMVVLAVTFGAPPSKPGTPYLGNPMWTATASIAGYALGAESIILYEPGGTAIVGRDIATGDARWTMKVASEPRSITDLGNGVAAVVMGDWSTDDAAPRDTTVTLLITYGGTILARIPGSTVVPIVIGPYLFVATGEQSVTAGCPGDRDSCTDGSTFDTAAERQLWRLPPHWGRRSPDCRCARRRCRPRVHRSRRKAAVPAAPQSARVEETSSDLAT